MLKGRSISRCHLFSRMHIRTLISLNAVSTGIRSALKLRGSGSGTRSFRFPLPPYTIQGSLESFCGNTTSFHSFSAIINGISRFASLFMKIF